VGNPNTRLAAVIAASGWSHTQVASAFVRVAREISADELYGVGRSHVSHWVAGSKPSGRAPLVLCEALSRRFGRALTLTELGLPGAESGSGSGPLVADWRADALVELTDLGKVDTDVDRRLLLSNAVYSVAALALPPDAWWGEQVARGRARTGTARVGRGDVEAVREMVSAFSRIDQRHGGGHARTAVVQYLAGDVGGRLRGSFAGDEVRRAMFSAAGELAYLCGWMAFDNAEHTVAQHYFTIAVKLAAEADDAPMAGHVLRAMAHQAVDLGHVREGLSLAAAAMDGPRYTLASPRERALFGVVHARSLAASGDRRGAAKALVRAENDLAAAEPGDGEPARVFFFGEASLAHETACTLRDSGDLRGSVRAFRRSVRTRKVSSFTRTHAVTLGYLGEVQARQGGIEEACATWATALDAMDGIRSGRTRQVAAGMRSVLSPLRRRGIRAVTDVHDRAVTYLNEAR
jgi:hypothetical protein